jgi:hypothetical protein
LECLELTDLVATAHATQILRRIGEHPKLRQVSLKMAEQCTQPDELATLSAMLRSSNLHSLNLTRYYFDRTSWECLVEALQASPSVTKLSLDSCDFDKEAALDLVPGLNQTCVKDLYFNADDALLSQYPPSTLTPSSMMVELLTSCSTLNELHLDGIYNLEESDMDIFRRLNAARADVRVPCLILDLLKSDEPQEFAEWLPHSVTLQSFCCCYFGERVQASRVVRALRENGSMVHFSVPVEYFSKDDTRMIKAYGQRNEQLPKLLANSSSVVNSPESELHLFPTFFAVAKQSPRMACNTILIGLLTIDEASA